MIGYCIFVVNFLLLILLSGCSILRIGNLPSLFLEKNIKQFNCKETILSDLPSVLTIPKKLNQIDKDNQKATSLYMHCCNWNTVVQSMINKMLQIREINSGSILLIEKIIKNDMNPSLNLREIGNILHKIFADNNGRFTLVSTKKFLLAKRKLGLLPQDSLDIRSKEIGIARNVGAKYILYSTIIRDINTLELKMQLISTQSGEIFWSEKTII